MNKNKSTDIYINGGKLGLAEEITLPEFNYEKYTDEKIKELASNLGIPLEILMEPIPPHTEIGYCMWGRHMHTVIEKEDAFRWSIKTEFKGQSEFPDLQKFKLLHYGISNPIADKIADDIYKTFTNTVLGKPYEPDAKT